MMIHWFDDGAGTWGPEIVVILNFDRNDVTYTLPEGRSWGRIVDTQAYFDGEDYLAVEGLDLRKSANIDLAGTEVVTGAYTAKGTSVVILEQR